MSPRNIPRTEMRITCPDVRAAYIREYDSPVTALPSRGVLAPDCRASRRETSPRVKTAGTRAGRLARWTELSHGNLTPSTSR